MLNFTQYRKYCMIHIISNKIPSLDITITDPTYEIN